MIFSCSPRPGGNCDDAAEIARAAAEAGKTARATEIVRLRDYTVHPCTGCQRCSVSPVRCPLRDKDDAERLFGKLQNAPELVLIAPIYFYHLPAQLKALIDRSQIFWNLCRKGEGPAKTTRKAHAILVGGREKGDRLFAGSLLTLRYWLPLFAFELAEPLCLYGVDEPGDLVKNSTARDRLVSYVSAVYDG